MSDDNLLRICNCIWVPPNDTELNLKLIVAACGGSAEHRDVDATASLVKELFKWTGMDADIYIFVHD